MTHTSPRFLLIAGLLMLVACSNPFAPDPHIPEGKRHEPAPAATTPQQLMDNLHRSMRDRDEQLYEILLDEEFLFTETDCQGDLIFDNGREQELEIMAGSWDGSEPGIFDIYRNTFEFDFQPIKRGVELGEEYPEAFPGDPDGHPDEDWEIFRGRVTMLLLDVNGDGFQVDQIMTYKLRLGEDGTYRLIRWINDPLSGDCGVSKRVAGLYGWSAVKQSPR